MSFRKSDEFCTIASHPRKNALFFNLTSILKNTFSRVEKEVFVFHHHRNIWTKFLDIY